MLEYKIQYVDVPSGASNSYNFLKQIKFYIISEVMIAPGQTKRLDPCGYINSVGYIDIVR